MIWKTCVDFNKTHFMLLIAIHLQWPSCHHNKKTPGCGWNQRQLEIDSYSK